MKTTLDTNTLLQQLAQLILEATDTAEAEGLSLALSRDLILERLPTANDLARQLGLDAELVKKKLKVLKQDGIIQATSFSPKRYRFDRYQLAHLEEDSQLYPLFCGDTPSHPLRLD